MTDYLKKLDDKIAEEQNAYFEKKRYCEGYLEALATIRYIVRNLIEHSQKEESEVEK